MPPGPSVSASPPGYWLELFGGGKEQILFEVSNYDLYKREGAGEAKHADPPVLLALEPALDLAFSSPHLANCLLTNCHKSHNTPPLTAL